MKFRLKLGFSGKNPGVPGGDVIIETMQGPREGTRAAAQDLNRELGKPWPDFLFEVLEEHAAKHGYRRVMLRSPEELDYFREPTVMASLSKEIQDTTGGRIKYLRTGVSKGGKPQFSREELAVLLPAAKIEAQYRPELQPFSSIIKDGKLVMETKSGNPPTKAQLDAFFVWLSEELSRHYQKREIQRTMKNFYYRVAKNNGYRRVKIGGEWFFVKNLKGAA